MVMAKVIAALETNHQGDSALARRLVDTAAECGCGAVKLPVCSVRDSYTADFLEQPCHEYPELGDTTGRVLEALQLDRAARADVRAAARGRLEFIAAPYDLGSLTAIDALDVDAYQIDPAVLAHLPLVREVARRGRPVIVVAGMCGERELDRVIDLVAGLPTTILHCVIGASDLSSTALGYLSSYRDRYRCDVGYLSLEPGVQAALVACALGASVVEKPLTIDRALRGPAHARSADREQMTAIVSAIRDLEAAVAPVGPRQVLPPELEAFAEGRAALVAARDLQSGAVLAWDMLAAKAPLRGVSPALVDLFVGRKLLYDVPADAPITFGMVDL
jgi:sialic acid synthase SpsE